MDSNSYSRYLNKLKDVHCERERQPITHPRYVRFEDRLEKSDLNERIIKQHMNGRDLMQWCGVVLLKSLLDYCIYQLLLQELKPVTIIETGTFNGGGALWMADLMKMHNAPTHVYSMDIDLSYIDPSVRNREDITLIKGDANNIKQAFTGDMLKNLPHPWLITDDAHVNLPGVLGHFDQFTESGDYIIVEDTHPFLPLTLGSETFETTGTAFTHEPFKEFMKICEDHYRVDSAYTDLYGYNATWNYNSILHRV